ncbi:hypothetical protein F3Y22_tig00111358pilonHSYRG00071 [Hibiscus syriacus]|uniref:X8 domain-containing protein n=1 Tax=Hibiscus syriacus TaxID=106335 RepID=A0A6A2YNN6_HIBSY|nr:hypothetical protein F3Y22_tig00111358pilonHSYRG00071 [Hibiscus syriacus]
MIIVIIMNSMNKVSFLLLTIFVFHLISSIVVFEANQNDSKPNAENDTEADGKEPKPNTENAIEADGKESKPNAENVVEDKSKEPNPNTKKFCVPKDQASDADLQKALDWECGQSIDSNPIKPSGPYGNPSTVKSRAKFAMNSYYRSKEGGPRACDFSGTATLVPEDPSYDNCKYV